MAFVGIAILILGLLSIPLGLPGLWIMLGVAAVAAILGEVGLMTLIACAIIATFAELVEFFILRKLTKQYGGSRKAFWGAIGGGFVGAILGAPFLLIVGAIIGGMVGAFAGAALVTYAETKQFDSAQRVGWSAVLGRMLTAVAKTAAGVAILILAAAALLN